MLRGRWSIYAALGGLALALAFLWLEPLQCFPRPEWIGGEGAQQQVEQQQQESRAGNAPFVERETPPTDAREQPYDPHREADLRQQTRMASAAERTLTAVRCQNRLLAFDGVLLVLTVLAAFMAVFDARRQSERQLRAYVSTEVRDITNWDVNDLAKEVTVAIKNFGQTPAYDLRANQHFERVPFSDLSKEPDLKPLFISERGSSDCVGPGDKRQRNWTLAPLSVADLSKVEAGQLAWFVYGIIRYRDAFGKARTTRYRYFIGGPMGFKERRLLAAPTGNEAD